MTSPTVCERFTSRAAAKVSRLVTMTARAALRRELEDSVARPVPPVTMRHATPASSAIGWVRFRSPTISVSPGLM
jgi:hypothetical protein